MGRIKGKGFVSPMWLIILLSYFLTVPLSLQAQTEMGNAWFDVQEWFFVDDANKSPIIEGYVANMPHVSSGAFSDHDWNIDVKPSQGYEWSLRNNQGLSNADGLIEMELENGALHLTTMPDPLDFASIFPIGTKVKAHGWWVQDCAHDCKTELHPFISLLGGSYDHFAFLVGQDISTRFDVVSDLTESLNITGNFGSNDHSSDIVKNGSFSRQLGGTTGILREEALVDFYSDPFYSIYRTKAIAELSFGKVKLTCQLKPPIGNLLGVPTGFVPFYLGTFDRSSGGLLIEDVNYAVETLPSGNQKVKADVKVRLSGPDRPILYSKWRYDRSDPSVANTTTEQELTGQKHEITFQLIYSPALGLTETSWGLQVVGSTRDKDWTPSDEGLLGPRQRAFVFDWRNYYLDPSNLSTSSKEIYSEVTRRDNQGNENKRKCISGYDINANTYVIPGVRSQIVWSVKQIKDASGNPIPSASEQVLALGQPTSVGGSTFVTDNAGAHMTISFGDSGWNDGGILDKIQHAWVPNNVSQVIVSAKLETALGETITNPLWVSQPTCCSNGTCPPLPGTNRSFAVVKALPDWHIGEFDPIERVIVVMVEANRRGLIERLEEPGAHTPLMPVLPIQWTKDTFKEGLPRLGHPEGWYESLPKVGQKLADAYLKAVFREVLSGEEREILAAARQAGQSLPAFKIRPEAQRLKFAPRMMNAEISTEELLMSSLPSRLYPGMKIDLRDVQFKPNSEILTTNSLAVLNRLADSLGKTPKATIEITVHSDTRPDALPFTQRRAEAIRNYLTNLGINKERIIVSGAGESVPLFDNSTELGRIQNQRVDLIVR